MKIAIIGTAGRDKNIPMTRALWDWMTQDVRERVREDGHVVSGGAAWADHLAVWLFLKGFVKELTLHLPAPLNGKFLGPYQSAASAANYYHERFSNVVGCDTLAQIEGAAPMDHCYGTFEPAAPGYGAMFNRNKKVAAAIGPDDLMLAYTFGEGDVPADGGTRDTWNQCRGKRIHIPLPRLT